MQFWRFCLSLGWCFFFCFYSDSNLRFSDATLVNFSWVLCTHFSRSLRYMSEEDRWFCSPSHTHTNMDLNRMKWAICVRIDRSDCWKMRERMQVENVVHLTEERRKNWNHSFLFSILFRLSLLLLLRLNLNRYSTAYLSSFPFFLIFIYFIHFLWLLHLLGCDWLPNAKHFPCNHSGCVCADLCDRSYIVYCSYVREIA